MLICRYLKGQDSREYFCDIEINPTTAIATILDPRWKTGAFTEKSNAHTAKENLIQLAYRERSGAVKTSRQSTLLEPGPDSDPSSSSTRKTSTAAEVRIYNLKHYKT